MKKNFFLFAAFLSQSIAFGQTQWTQTSGTVSFSIKNRGSNVEGHFGNLQTKLVFSPDKPEASSLKGSLDVTTINTNNGKRDKDLQGDTYFDAGKYKLIEVSSVKLAKKGSVYSGTFNVTIKGKTKVVEIPFQFTESGNQGEFKAAFTINRKDFSVGGESGLAMFMSDDVHVSIDVKAKK